MHEQTQETFRPVPELTHAAGVFKLLSHPYRLMICCHLLSGESSVGAMETDLGIRQPNLSRELGKLRNGGLLATRRESKVVYYRLADTDTARMIRTLCDCFSISLSVEHPTQTALPAAISQVFDDTDVSFQEEPTVIADRSTAKN
ncbi:metalloregulator ArsR/SmtB family transcription factor [Parvularcula marina]|uniref:metalloregulator ArsR/SmtB family transcription factor n=1 Tax=Parvularcula marina TaxID=2292771 RepID=UPI003516B07E